VRNALKNLLPTLAQAPIEACHVSQLNGKRPFACGLNHMVQSRNKKHFHHVNSVGTPLSGPCWNHANFEDPKQPRTPHIEHAQHNANGKGFTTAGMGWDGMG
jgi:hypothetical protein